MTDQHIAHYQLLSRLGQGAMGVVYRARDTRLQRDVALKLLQLSPAEQADGEYAARLLQEARSAARLNHPGIITVYDCGEWQGQPYMAMELVSGQTLKTLLEERGPLTIKQVAGLAKQVFDALAHAHEQGVVHRDIKPANLMLTANGRLKIMDFGIAQLPASDLTRTGTLLGSPRYMAPEQLGGTKLDGRADLFSAGVVLYQALTGQLPFDGEQPIAIAYQILHAQPVPPREVRPDTPEALSALILRCLAKRPDARYRDARTALADLLRLQRGHGQAITESEPVATPNAPVATPSAAFQPAAIEFVEISKDASRLAQRTARALWPYLRSASNWLRIQLPRLGASLKQAAVWAWPHAQHGSRFALQQGQRGWARYRSLQPRQQLIGAAVALLGSALIGALLLSSPPKATQTAAEAVAVAPPAPLPEVKLSPATEGVPPDTAPAVVEVQRPPPQYETAEPDDAQATAETIAPPMESEPEHAGGTTTGIGQELKQAGRGFSQAVGSAWDCLRGRAACPEPNASNDPREQRRGP
ncbi:serine/threonine-protein kinase [Chitinolyticbacter meiyuanensis]|uniref:serine/threonine-protein kinase n=1 Tax=Chitinolyticbacter meiyuanensis TaxID=682798 RepID=UPI00165261B0|nr:serine/threonine-protein kinase [Chitinolyticbacter meiyuanensis]